MGSKLRAAFTFHFIFYFTFYFVASLSDNNLLAFGTESSRDKGGDGSCWKVSQCNKKKKAEGKTMVKPTSIGISSCSKQIHAGVSRADPGNCGSQQKKKADSTQQLAYMRNKGALSQWF